MPLASAASALTAPSAANRTDSRTDGSATASKAVNHTRRSLHTTTPHGSATDAQSASAIASTPHGATPGSIQTASGSGTTTSSTTAATLVATAAAIYRATSRQLLDLQTSLTSLSRRPVLCDKLVCDTAPLCFTDYEPRVHVLAEGEEQVAVGVGVGQSSTDSHRTGAVDSNQQGNNSSIPDALRPPLSTDALSLSAQVVGAPHKWSLELSFFDKNAVQKGVARGLGYMDRKYIYVSHGAGAKIGFLVTVAPVAGDGSGKVGVSGTARGGGDGSGRGSGLGGGRQGMDQVEVDTEGLSGRLGFRRGGGAGSGQVWLCECQKGFLKYPPGMVDLDVGGRVYVEYNVDEEAVRAGKGGKDGKEIKDGKEAGSKNGGVAGVGAGLSGDGIKLLPVVDQCYKLDRPLPVGTHVVWLVQQGEGQINVGYLLYW